MAGVPAVLLAPPTTQNPWGARTGSSTHSDQPAGLAGPILCFCKNHTFTDGSGFCTHMHKI